MVAVNPKVVAVIDLDLGAPRRTGYDAAADRRHGIYLINNRAIRLKSWLLYEAPGPSDVGIDEEDGFIAIFKVTDAIFVREQFVERDTGHHGQRQRLPFIA